MKLEPVVGEVKINWTHNIGAKELLKTEDGGNVGASHYGNYFKLDSTVSVLWSTSFTSLEVASIKETSDGGYIVLANNSLVSHDQKIQIIKLDRNLKQQWKSSVIGLYTTEGKEVIENRDGSFVVAGIGSGIQKK
ncbi:hypothetical protein MKX68_07430 [Paenibacillus sp. FSL M8-0212]|uniref:hypothetical protein n=1 Tax=Paenibacillus sp. FSL M8-0212 TaxID=2921618 RepID=UPI0030F53575